MSVAYRILYRLGLTPWEHTEPPGPLAALIEGPRARPAGAMLDIGCGTGTDAIYAALHGWNVTAIDIIPRALAQARHNASQAGANVRILRADITKADQAGLSGPFSLLLDRGCLHSLTAAQQRAAAGAISSLAASGAILLMFAFAPGRRGPAPRGIDPAQLPVLFPHWDVGFSRDASEVFAAGPMRNSDRSWHQLVKR